MAGHSNGGEGKNAMFPKPEEVDFDFPSYTTFSRDAGDTSTSSSGSKVRAFFIGMGFLPSLVDKVIEENGEENPDALLEILLSSAHKSNCDSSDSFEGSLNTNKRRSAPNSSTPNFHPQGHSKEALQNSNSESSDSLDSLFDDKDPPEVSMVNEPKEEPDEVSDVFEDKRSSLLMMNFSVEEVEFAIHKLGDAPVPDLVDFIFAAQIARKMEKEAADDITFYERGNETNEKLFGIMAKTLQLLEMGFSENEVSSAIDKLGTEVPISELANFIFAEQNGIDYVMEYKYPYTSAYFVRIKDEDLYGTEELKPEIFSDVPSQSRQVNLGETSNGERVKEEDYIDGFPGAVSDMRNSEFMENDRSKRPKYEYDDDSNSSLDPYWVEEKVDPVIAGMARLYNSNPSRCLTNMQAKPPFFLFGNVSNITYDSWTKMSHFLYAIKPEFVNSQFFSALNRIEGYIHNLPVENRFHILPKQHMTIEDAIPRTKKWWPPWDLRKQLNGIYCETGGIAQLCDRLGKILADSGGVPTSQQQKDILRYCHGLNLVWTGKYKLGPIEPEHLELVLGYPSNHTRECDLTERLKLLKYCFQTDTLGYHLSVLRSIFPNGLTVLSLFSGIGGAEIALHRLDIKLKAVVSVDTSVSKRKILERWWRSSGQTGTLVQFEGIQKLTNKTFESLISRFGGFDLVIYQNPCSQANPRAHASESLSASEFSEFFECVRILQRVRTLRPV